MTAKDRATLTTTQDELRADATALYESAERFARQARRLGSGMSAGRARNNADNRVAQLDAVCTQVQAIEAVLAS